MQPNVTITILVAYFVGLVLFWLWDRSNQTRRIKGLLREVGGDAAPPQISTGTKRERDYHVKISDAQVTCSRPDGTIEKIAWSDLHKVEILTTDEGPEAPDIFWVLHGTRSGCVIPWGATGAAELLTRLQELPGFRNDAIIDAASLTTNNQLECWIRE